MHDPMNSSDSNRIATGVPTKDQHAAPPSSPTTSSALEGLGSKSPLKVPHGVIVRTPSGKDSQGRKTPPRFFTITNQQLQQMHSTGDSTEPIGPKHFKFKDANQTVDGRRECSCTNSPRKNETGQNPKATRDCPEKIEGTITLKSLLESEIRRSNLIQTTKAQKGGNRTERDEKANPLSSPISSQKGKLNSPVDFKHHKEFTTTALHFSGERRESLHVTAQTKTTWNKPTTTTFRPSNSEISDRNITPKPPTPKFKSRSPSLDYFEHHLPTPDNKVPKGCLLDMLLSSTELFDNDRMSKLGITSLGKDNPGGNTRTAAVTGEHISAVHGKTSDERNPSLSTGIDTSNCTTNGLHELEGTNSNRLLHGAAGIITSKKSIDMIERNQKTILAPEAHTEYVPILKSKSVGASDDPCKKVKSKFSLDASTPSNSTKLQMKTSEKPKAPVVPVSSLQVMDKPLLTQSDKCDVPHSFQSSSTRIDIAELPSTSHVKRVSGTLGGNSEIKREDHKMITFDNFQKTPKTSQTKCMSNNITPEQEHKDKCAPKTTLVINPVMSTSVTASPCSPGSSGQLYGLVRSSNNPTGPMVLVALGTRPQSSNGSTTLTASGNHLNSLKPQSCTPVVINNLASTGNVNADAFNVWKSYVRKAYQDKYGANCDYYMHNQWVSMSVAEKSPFVHEARNRSHPPVLVQTSTGIPSLTAKDVRKVPAAKNSKPVIQRQINVIPKLQTTAPDRPIAESPVSMNEQDILKELYRSTNMAGLSPDFPMSTNNSTFRKMMRGSGNILTDPTASLDPLFAQCLLSGRRYDIDNWIAMKTNWRVTPEWIVDFLADYDERKRARRAAIDAGVMRRVAMVQRMARMEHDDDDDDAGTSTSTVQTPHKHSGKRYQQESVSTENTPKCQEKTQQSVSIEGSGPTEGVDNRNDKNLTSAKTPNATQTPSRGFGLVPTDSQDQMTSSYGNNSHNACQRSSDLKPGNLPRVVPPMTPTPSCPRGSSTVTASLPTGQDKGLPGQISTQNVDNNSMSQKDGGYSQDENVLGDLDLIDDEELWNIQCSLFPPWQRVQSFIDSDAADDFFKDLDKDSIGVSDALPLAHVSYAEQLENIGEEKTSRNSSQSDVPADAVYQTGRGKHCPEALSIKSSLIEEITPSEESRSIVSSAITHIEQSKTNTKNPTNVERCLFSDTPVKNACQPIDSDPTENTTPSIPFPIDAHEEMNCGDDFGEIIESTNTDADLGKGSQSTDPLGRRKEEDAAASKLRELLNKTHQPLLSDHVVKDIVIIQDNTSEDGRATEENILKDVFPGVSDTAYDIRGKTGVRSSEMFDGTANLHEELKPIIVMSAEPLPASLVTDVLEPMPVENMPSWNKITRANYNNNMHGSDGKNKHSNQLGKQRDIVNEIYHDPLVDAGSPDRGGGASQISQTKADTKDHSSDIERWHEEIQPIIALAVNSSSSSSSVENDVRRTHSEDDQRATPTVTLQVNTECDKTTEPLKDNDKVFTEEELKAIHTVASSSGEYVTADETELYSARSNDMKTPDNCPTSTSEPSINTGASEALFSEIAHSSITSHLSTLPVSADIPTTSGNVESGIVEEDTHPTICGEEKKTCGSAPRYHDRRRKKGRQDAFLGDSRETNVETSILVAQSSSESSMTSVASSSSSSSSSLISTRRKSRGKKRKRKMERPRKKPDRKTKRDGCSPSVSHPSAGASALHSDADKNDSEGDAPAKSSKTKSAKRSSRTTTAKSSKHYSPKQKDDGDRSPEPHDVHRIDHEGDDGSSGDSPDEFVIENKSPTSLKMRTSSRLKIRRVSKLPRLRSKRHASVSFQKKASKMSFHGKVTKTGRRGSRNK